MKERPEQKLLKHMLKVFSIFMIKLYYKDNDNVKRFVNKYINSKKIVSCKMINKNLSEFFTVLINYYYASTCWSLLDYKIKGTRPVIF